MLRLDYEFIIFFFRLKWSVLGEWCAHQSTNLWCGEQWQWYREAQEFSHYLLHYLLPMVDRPAFRLSLHFFNRKADWFFHIFLKGAQGDGSGETTPPPHQPRLINITKNSSCLIFSQEHVPYITFSAFLIMRLFKFPMNRL